MAKSMATVDAQVWTPVASNVQSLAGGDAVGEERGDGVASDVGRLATPGSAWTASSVKRAAIATGSRPLMVAT